MAVNPGNLGSLDLEHVLNDVDGYIYGPIPGFLPKHFPNAGCTESQRKGDPAGVPATTSFLEWFATFFSGDSDEARGTWHAPRQPDVRQRATSGSPLFLSFSSDVNADADSTWGNVQVVGTYVPDGDDVTYRHGLLSLSALAEAVFASQPVRLFLHGFYIRHSCVEFWMFDRAGIYSSDTLSLQDDFARFIDCIRTYRLMSDKQLGRSDLIQSDSLGSYICLDEPEHMPQKKLYLEDKPVRCASKILGPATTCYLARVTDSDKWSFAVRFKWRYRQFTSEGELLPFLESKGVRNICSLIYHKEIHQIKHLRSNLRFGPLRKFLETEPETMQARDVIKMGVTHYTEETDDLFENPVLTCVVTSPVGRPLETFRDTLELLRALRDAIIGHRSLLQDAGVLHQDISDGNILIVDGDDRVETGGLLIDYDRAIHLSEQNQDGISITGTKVFIAIEHLEGATHTYRHDVESFFWVFLWMVILDHGKEPPMTSRLRKWSELDWADLAVCKAEDLHEHGFQAILAEFPPESHLLRPLAQKLHQMLFPLRDGVIFTGSDNTPGTVDALYDGFVGALDDAIAFCRP